VSDHTADTVEVIFFADGAEHRGTVRRSAILHQALEQVLPHELLRAHHLRVTRADGTLLYPDMFLHEIVAFYGDARFVVEATPLREAAGEWTNYGFDHLALATTERATARDFFSVGLNMKIVRDDEHLTVVTTGNTALFLFDAKPGAPLSDGLPSRIHHIGFVVDHLEAAYGHLRRAFPAFASDWTLLEREERLSLYGHITFGEVRFMIQLSEIKAQYRGFKQGTPFADVMYDYASQEYGVRLG
jgi:catechol 2,3-dioxygenase-like lactoylglutathione lyase family enzyme